MAAPFRGGRFLGVTWDGAAGEGLGQRVHNALEGWTIIAGDGWLVAADRLAHCGQDDAIITVTAIPELFDRGSASLRGPEQLARALTDDAAGQIASLGAPFRLLWANRSSAEIHAATDPVGLGPVFWTQQPGLSACASSASLLALLFDKEPEPEAIAAFALFGVFPFSATPYAGISKLLAGNQLRLRAGELVITSSPRGLEQYDSVGQAFSSAVGAMAVAAPDAALEMSGGLDSRLVVAALPPDMSSKLRGVTLDESGGTGPDVRIARRIAALRGISHRALSLPSDLLEGGEGLDDLLRRIVDGYDAMANPVDKVPLLLASDASDRARFGGQNGEIIRGFFYPMQALAQEPTPQLFASLVDWRLIANDRVNPRLFSPAFRDGPLAAARETMLRDLAGYQGAWGEVLDQIYLFFRMQAWVGIAAGNRFIDRVILWPFFDANFLNAAMKLDPLRKRDSLVAYEMLAALDPKLADMPLDSGLVPSAMVAGGLRAKMMKLRVKALKAVRKVMQRIRPRSSATLGSARIVERWHASGGFRHLDIQGLLAMGIFDEAQLRLVASGAVKPDRATLGFLLLCEAWMKPS